uniref:Si:ch211-274f20.2 n=1 Tax=Paramormyrops kingsleyae TaxID=1676925 RepID=A0A3B3QIC4_9TELE|nr:calnexin-like isoform X1 [Paramormyrops kingsleyae]XP_023672154.1 calnexin-like isoform X1 [Paramormyrops kingsleyae]
MKLQSAISLCACLFLTLADEGRQNTYRSPAIPEEAHFAETFDSGPLDRKWVLSKAQKAEKEDILKYNGRWAVEEGTSGNRGLVLKSPGRHHAIAAYLRTIFHFTDKPLILQYEVLFQNGVDCGGAYIKLLTHTDHLRLSQFCDTTPYTIMFGPDKCGGNQKIYFIFRHRNPLTGKYQEKHARQTAEDLSRYFTDRQPHLYTLRLYPDNRYEILIDEYLVSKGSLLEDVDPSVNPPQEVADPHDTKPADWDDRPRIPDPMARKPMDWDEEAPELIPDPAAQRVHGWLEDEQPFISDPEAQRPDDWDEDMDGKWEPPLVSNPVCSDAVGCGQWEPPLISNPAYKGKWSPPLIQNPNYQGQWSPRTVTNPEYFEDSQPFQMSPVAAVGLELWSTTGDVLFDNILLCSDVTVAQRWTTDTWGQRQTPGLLMQLLMATEQRPWLWALYVFTVGLPAILFISFMWPDKTFGPPDQDYCYKKTDKPQPDSPHDPERDPGLWAHSENTSSRKRETRQANRKADLELKID